MKTTLQIVNDKVTELGDLYSRMDRTMERLYPEDYPYELTLYDSEIKTKETETISVTSNIAQVFMDAVAADLMAAKWQDVIEGKVSARQTRVIESFISDMRAQADEQLLSEFDIPSLDSWLCKHICERGLIGAFWLSIVENGKLKLRCLPVDMRWTPFERGAKGLRWFAPRTTRSVAAIKEEYEMELEGKGISLPDSSVDGKKITDFWDDKINEVWLGNQLIRSQSHKLGRPPGVIVGAASGTMLRDKGYLKHENEDLLQFIRHLLDEHNRNLSVKQTAGQNGIIGRYEAEQEIIDGSPSHPVPGPGQALDVAKGGKHVLVPMPDSNIAFRSADAEISQEIQMGSISNAELADTGVDRTALWIATQQRIRSGRMKPRTGALEVFRQQLDRLMIDQFIRTSKDESGELLIGKTGSKTQYSAAKLGDPEKYTIQCRMMTKSKEEEIANLAEAAAARGAGIPQAIIDRDIMMAEDPDEWERLRQLQAAREADPAIALFEMAIKYAEEAEDLEDEADADAKRIQSMMLTERGVALIRARQQPTQPALPEKVRVPSVEQPKGSAQALLPLIAGASKGRGDGGQPARQEMIAG